MSDLVNLSDTLPAPSSNGLVSSTHPKPNSQDTIGIRGARQDNLKNIDLELPRDRRQ